MLKSVVVAIVFLAAFSQPVDAYPRPLEILLEGVDDIGERARLIRIYQKPITEEDKKLVNAARAKANAERGKSSKNTGKKKGGKKKGKKGNKKKR